jgi:thioesterase domain-containing protein
MLAKVEAAFGQRLGFAELLERSRFSDFVTWLGAATTSTDQPKHVVALTRAPGQPAVFAFAQLHVFKGLARHLEGDLAMTGLQLLDPSCPRGELPTTIEAIGKDYARLIQSVQPSGPCTLLGWCNGGTVAFETARHLEQAGIAVERVIMVDTWCPNYKVRLGWIRAFLADFSYRSQAIVSSWKRSSKAGMTFWQSLRQRRTLIRLLGVPKDIELPKSDPFDVYLTAALDQRLVHYTPQPIRAPLTILRSSSEPQGFMLDRHFGWAPYTAAAVETLTIPGDHFTVFAEPGVSAMAAYIRSVTGTSPDA